MPKRSATHSKPPAPPIDGNASERLQKLLAAAGLGSRRKCEELILAGRVEVDRRVVRELGTKADPQKVDIRVDGVSLARPRLVYFLVNKPTGVVSTNSDPSGRPRVIDLIAYSGRLFTVGRLDMSSEGLILVTNDGELANRLTHPRYGVEKTYQVEVAGTLERQDLDKLHKGVHLAEGFAHVVSAKIKHQYRQSTLLEIVLNEGRNREIRRLLARVGHKAMRLKRVALGPLRLADLPAGQVRPLLREELKSLRQAARDSHPRPARGPRPADRKPLVKATPQRAVIGGDMARAGRATSSIGPRKTTPGKFRPRPTAAALHRKKRKTAAVRNHANDS